MGDNTRDCANCGHMEYHHRPECGYQRRGPFFASIDEALANGKCPCPEFAEPVGGAALEEGEP